MWDRAPWPLVQAAGAESWKLETLRLGGLPRGDFAVWAPAEDLLCGGTCAPAHGPQRPRLRVQRLVQDWLLCRVPV